MDEIKKLQKLAGIGQFEGYTEYKIDENPSITATAVKAKEKKLGLFAQNREQIIQAVSEMHENYEEFSDSVKEFATNFNGNGVNNTAKIVTEILEEKK